MAEDLTKFVPSYTNRDENKRARTAVTNEEWNNLWNLNSSQGDHSEKWINKIYQYLFGDNTFDTTTTNKISAIDTALAGRTTPTDVDTKIATHNTSNTAHDDIRTVLATKASTVADLGLTATVTELNYVDGVTSSIQTQIDGKENADNTIIKQINVIDSLSSTSTEYPLSAKQGKLLNDRITSLEAIGRFLSLWDCTTGIPTTNPTTLPYTYKAGDYYRVSVTDTTVATNNKKPTGSQYTGAASAVVETDTVKVGDTYYYDGTTWMLSKTTNILDSVLDVLVDGVSTVTGNTSRITLGSFGITATKDELNYTDGVTSNIQTQLDNKVIKNNDITAGTYPLITYDAKGLVTGGAALTDANIPNIPASKITSGTLADAYIASSSTWNSKSEKAVLYSANLASGSWSSSAQTITRSGAWPVSGYTYLVIPASSSLSAYAAANIYADDITTANQITFHCTNVPTDSLTVYILKMESING